MIKDKLRRLLNFLHLDLTKNLEYDRLTKMVLNVVVKKDSNTIDVGCHKGEILSILLNLAPEGKHFAFEPLPDYFRELQKKFGTKASIFPYALSEKSGTTNFQFVRNAPAFSGIKKRMYLTDNPGVEEIQVQMMCLDEVLPSDVKIDFIKIDVEGGELAVLKGGRNLIKKFRPYIIFEFGLGSSDFYGIDGKAMFDFLNLELEMNIATLKSFIKRGKPLSEAEFVDCFNSNSEYYFVAYP